jgi:peptide/nickel transport system substrate-binding protein
VHTVGGIVFPGSPLAADKEELQDLAGFWPDIEKSRAEAKRLLKEAGAEDLSFELRTETSTSPTNTTPPGSLTNGARSDST